MPFTLLGPLAVAFWMVATPSLAQAPGWSRGQQLLSITYEECVRRGPQALQAEGYRIDHAAGNFSVGMKEVHTAVIMCNPVPGEKEVVNIVVGSNGDGGGCHRERLQAQMERANPTTPIAPPCQAAQPQPQPPQPPAPPPPQPQAPPPPPQPQTPPQPPPCSPDSGIIHVVSGTYGANHSNVPRGNATRHLESQCNGRTECTYRVDATVLGDPAYGSAKEYLAEYNCGTGTPTQKVSLEGEESHGRTVTLRCVPCGGVSGANARVFQRVRPLSGDIAGPAEWVGTYRNRRYDLTLSQSGTGLIGTYRLSDLSDNGVQGVGEYRLGAPSGSSVTGTWKESFRDNDKTAQRSGIVKLTLVDSKTLQVEITEDEPTLTWNAGRELYPSKMRKGARWSETLTRVEAPQPAPARPGGDEGTLLSTLCREGNPNLRTYIRQVGDSLIFINEGGARSGGYAADNNTLIATDWEGGLRGTVSSDRSRIDWANGTSWRLCPQ